MRAIRSVAIAQNELSLISKLPPETLVNISEFVVEPRTRESMSEIVKMTHVCQYWRSTLISYPRLWSSVFVRTDRKDFAAACLERNREAPLTVHVDLTHGNYELYDDCTCIRDEWERGEWPERQIDERNPCRYHTTINPRLKTEHTQRIRTLDVRLTMLDTFAKEGPYQYFKDTLDHFELFTSPLPTLESLSFHVDPKFELGVDTYLEFPEDLFCWESLPPTRLCHLTLHGCYGGPFWTVRNLTSFELAGGEGAVDSIELDASMFSLFISNNMSLVSLSLSRCSFPDLVELSQAWITPVKLPELKFLRLMDNVELSSFASLVDVPSFKSFSSLRIFVQRYPRSGIICLRTIVHTESDDGFHLSYGPSGNAEEASDWLGAVYGADPNLAFIRFEGREPEPVVQDGLGAFPLSFFMKAKVLEIGGSFAGLRYRDFWEDLEQVGPQLTTLRLEVTGWMEATARSVEKFIRVRSNKGMPLVKLERMRIEGVSEEDEEKAEKLWEEFRAGLNIDQYLSPQ